jgi:formate/nitrite transporter
MTGGMRTQGPDDPPPRPALDALLPDAVARKAEAAGVAKAQRDGLSLLALSILAGAFIAFGAMLATIALAGSDGAMPFGIARLVAGLAFSLGLILVVVGGAELFTGDMLMVMAWASRRISTARMLRAWAVIYAGNLVGALGTAILVFLSGHHALGEGAIGTTALSVASAKAGLPLFQAFVLGILANVLVCMAVWATLGGRTVADKVLVIVLPVAAFVAAGFEHSIANMYLLPYAWMIRAGASAEFWTAIGSGAMDFHLVTLGATVANLLAVTAGNFVGGALLVGIVYWFIYLRP